MVLNGINNNNQNPPKSCSKIRLICQNVNGINEKEKRRLIVNNLLTYNPDICCLIDTKLKSDDNNVFKNDFDMESISCFGPNSSRGVTFIYKKKFPFTITSSILDPEGNFVILDVEIYSRKITLVGLYGPNYDSPTFFENIFDLSGNIGNSNIIKMGDYNVTLNHEIDNVNYVSPQHPRARAKLNELLVNNMFIDPIRLNHPDSSIYTYSSYQGPQRSRLDYFLASESLRNYIQDSSILPPYKSDHNPILLEVDFSSFTEGPGYYKIPNYILKNHDFVHRINFGIKETYAENIMHPNYGVDDNFNFVGSEEDKLAFYDMSMEEMSEFPLRGNPNSFLEVL